MTASHESRLRRIRVRWRLLGLPVRLAIQTAAVTAAGFAIFAILQTTDAIDATAASLLVAVVFGSATVLQHRQAQRRQYTEATRPPAITGSRHDASSPVAFVRFPGSEGVPNSGTR